MIEWLQKWYSDNCDGDWEHEYGVKINTLDNPGWSVTIDLSGTELEGLEMPYLLLEKSDDDWYAYSIKNNSFNGAGDSGKLNRIIETFKEIWDSKSNK